MSETDPIRAAFVAGAEQAALKSQVAQHEIRLDRINGSIDRAALSVEKLTDRFEEFVSKANERTAVEAKERELVAKQAKKATDRQLNSRTFIIGIAGVLVVLLGVIVTLLTTVHAI